MRHHRQPVAKAKEFREVGADHQERLTGGCKLADDSVDLNLAADVDTPSGFV